MLILHTSVLTRIKWSNIGTQKHWLHSVFRVEFDAYRSELEVLKLAPRTEANILKQANAQANYNTNKSIYDKLRADVGVKLQFLDENRVSGFKIYSRILRG